MARRNEIDRCVFLKVPIIKATENCYIFFSKIYMVTFCLNSIKFISDITKLRTKSMAPSALVYFTLLNRQKIIFQPCITVLCHRGTKYIAVKGETCENAFKKAYMHS